MTQGTFFCGLMPEEIKFVENSIRKGQDAHHT